MPPLSMSDMVSALSRATAKLSEPSLTTKVAQLRQSRAPDPLQQLQTSVILDLYDAVRQIQDALYPLLSTLPNVGAVRDAAAASQKAELNVSKRRLFP